MLTAQAAVYRARREQPTSRDLFERLKALEVSGKR
jgi:hypothetical protein